MPRYDVVTRVATANDVEPIYRAPSTRAPVLRDLSLYTPDNEALETYRIISVKRVHGRLWAHIAVPMRPNGSSGWVKRGWLGAAMVSHDLIVVDLKAHQLTVYQRGVPIFQAPVGVGRASLPTPTGHFWIAEAFSSDDAAYGPWAFGTTAYASAATIADGFKNGIVGIHGTNLPNLIPGNPSHGCIRLRDVNILKLKRIVDIGTAVWVQ